MSNVNSQMMTSDKQLYGACFRNRFPRIISEVAEVGLFKQKKKRKKKSCFQTAHLWLLSVSVLCPEKHISGCAVPELFVPVPLRFLVPGHALL